MKQIVFDIDGIVTEETKGFGEEKYMNRTPVNETIETIKDYKGRGFKIVLHTARYKEDRNITEKWLNKHDVPYDKLILGKPQADKYIDDKAVNEPQKEVLCFSGGLDSTIAYFYLNKPKSIYIDINSRYSKKEKKHIEKLKQLGMNIDIIQGFDLSDFEEGENAYISKRNLLLTLIASYYGNLIYLVGISGDNVEDKNPQAFRTMSYCFNSIQKEKELDVKITSPFWNKTKGELVRWFMENFDSFDIECEAEDILRTSISCYNENIKGQCGKCPSCFRKWIALKYCDIKYYDIDCDDWFENDIREWKGIKDYIRRFKAGYYNESRTEESMIVLEYEGLVGD